MDAEGTDAPPSGTASFRQHAAGYALRLGPLLILISALVRPDPSWDAATVLANVAADRPAQLTAALLGLVGAALLVPAVLGMMHMLRDRRTAWAHTGGSLASLGALVLALGYAVDIVIWQMTAPEVERGAMIALLGSLFEEPVTAILVRYLPALLAAGLVVLAIGLRAGQAGDPWTFYSLIVGSVLATYGSVAADRLYHILGWTLLFAAMFAIGRRILQATAEDWTNWPTWKISWTGGR